MNSYKNKIVE